MQLLGKIYAHGISQGAITAAQGGKFQHGFFSAALTAGLAPDIMKKIPSTAGRVLASSIVGGTASVLGGGKFANGAITGAYVMLFNEMMHDIEEKRKNLAESAKQEWSKGSSKWATKNNIPKCNVFAQDMMRENGMAPYDDRYLAAGVWGDSKSSIPK